MVKMNCFASLLRLLMLLMSMLDFKSLPMLFSSTAMVTLEHGTLSNSEGAVYPDSVSKQIDSNDCTFEVIL